MPGICAVAGVDPSVSLEPACRRMVRRMAYLPWFTAVECAMDSKGAALGAVTLSQDPGTVLASDERTQSTLVFDGEIYDAASERRRLAAAGVVCRNDSHAELLLRGWLHEGPSFLRRVNGLFAAACWNGLERRLSVFTDRFGLRPVYVAHAPGLFAVASEIKAILQNEALSRRWSEQGLAQFFSFGHFFNDDTFYSSIRTVPPGTAITYEAASDRQLTSRYWVPAATAEGSPAELTEALEEALVTAVKRRAAPGERLGLSLSGGMDARTILGLMPPALNLRSVSIGIEGSIDHKSARQLAALAGVPHHDCLLNGDFLQTFDQHLREMVLMTDGHYLDQGIVVPTLQTYRNLGIDYLLRGHGGELLHMKKAYAFSLDDETLGSSADALETWLFDHLSGYMIGGVPKGVFTSNVVDGGRHALNVAYSAAAAFDPPAQRVWQLFLTQRLHRETALSMHKFGCYATIRLPFIDNDVIDALLALPPHMKMEDQLQCGILKHRRPDFLDVTNANTGARPGANPLTVAFARTRLRLYSRLGVPGYQPYERLGLWLSRELRPMVTRLLLGEQFLSRGICRPEGVKQIIDEHTRRSRNHTFLIMALLIFELGQRLIDDPDGYIDELRNTESKPIVQASAALH